MAERMKVRIFSAVARWAKENDIPPAVCSGLYLELDNICSEIEHHANTAKEELGKIMKKLDGIDFISPREDHDYANRK